MSTLLKTIGFLVVVLGFLWILGDCAIGFTAFQHSYWWRRSGELPAGDLIERSRAIGAMRDISLRLNERHRDIVLPAFMMLTGSMVILFGAVSPRREVGQAERDAPSNTGGADVPPASVS